MRKYSNQNYLCFYSFRGKNKQIKLKIMKNLGLWILGIILSLFLGLLGTKAILSVSTLFGLLFIVELGFLKLYGLLAIINMLLFKPTDVIEEKDEDGKIKKVYNQILNKTLAYLIFWGMSFLMFYILN